MSVSSGQANKITPCSFNKERSQGFCCIPRSSSSLDAWQPKLRAGARLNASTVQTQAATSSDFCNVWQATSAQPQKTLKPRQSTSQSLKRTPFHRKKTTTTCSSAPGRSPSYEAVGRPHFQACKTQAILASPAWASTVWISQVPIAIFFTVFLVNRQLTGLAALTKTLAERSVCVLVQGGFLKLSLSEACNLTKRSFQQKTKKTTSSKKQENSVQTGKGNFELKKRVLLCMNLLLNLKKVVNFMNLASFQCFLDSLKFKKKNQCFCSSCSC